MRANRLLSLMLLLQSRERMTAEELAKLLGVSKRTIYRDIEALDLAGVPIYTQDGRNGGIYLDRGYRISLNGLGREEIQALFISGSRGPMSDIGFEDAMENALLKLLAGLPLRYRDEAQRIRQRIHFDTSQWFYQRDVGQWMPMLLHGVFEDRKLALHYLGRDATETDRIVHPYGIVAKLDIWYLVAMTEEGDIRTFRVSRFQSVKVLDETFERSPSFNLVEYWKESTRRYEAAKPRYILKVRVGPGNPNLVRYLCEAYGAQIAPPDQPGWTLLTLNLAAMEEARMVVMGMGDRIDIVDPPELRDEVRKWLDLLMQHYEES